MSSIALPARVHGPRRRKRIAGPEVRAAQSCLGKNNRAATRGIHRTSGIATHGREALITPGPPAATALRVA